MSEEENPGNGQDQTPGTQEQTPPWGDDFDAQKAWNLVQNLRGDKEGLQSKLTQAQADQQELENLRREKLTADERAIADAREQASTEARTAAQVEADSKWGSKLLEAVSGAYLDADQQKSFLAIADPGKFMKDGEFDVTELMGHLTAIYGVKQRQFGSGLPQHHDWGQNTGQPPGTSGADLGLAEAQKRFGKRT